MIREFATVAMLRPAAGAVPGLSTLRIGNMLERFPETTGVGCCWARFRHAYAEAGLGSMMDGILEAVDRPVALSDGRAVPVLVSVSGRG